MAWKRALAAASLSSLLVLSPACSVMSMSQAAPSAGIISQRPGAKERITEERRLFRKWEPFLEGMSGKEPVPHNRVHFVSSIELKKKCKGEALGCYVTKGLFDALFPPRIYMDEQMRYPGSDASRSITAPRCAPHEIPPSEIPLLVVWLHEQGHHFGRERGKTADDGWIGETEAIAFAYRFAEASRVEDSDAGQALFAYMLGDLIQRRDLFGSRFGGDMRSALDSAGKSMGTPTYLAHLSVFLLRHTGFKSYSEVWRFVHENDTPTIAARIRENWNLLDSKITGAKVACNQMRETLP